MRTIFNASIYVDEKKYFVEDLKDMRISATVTDVGKEYIYRRFQLTNNSTENSGQITYTLDAILPCKNQAWLHTLKGDDWSRDSFFSIDKELSIGERYVMKPDGGRPAYKTAFPFFDLTLDGKTYLFAVGWTGQWKCEIFRGVDGIGIVVGLEYADFYLKSGETLNLPSICIMESKQNEKAADVRRRFRRMLMTDMNPLPKGTKGLPLALQCFDLYYWHSPVFRTEAGQMQIIEAAKKIGNFNTYWLDAAWFKDAWPYGPGNFSYDKGFSNGLKPIADVAHKADMKFILWFEPERVQRGTEIYVEHPEYVLAKQGEENIHVYNLGNEEAYQYLYGLITKIIRENKVDFYRQDFNELPLQYWLEHDAKGRVGITEIYHVNALYRLWDALRHDFPEMLIDCCSSGGTRIDFETARRAVFLWRSDVSGARITTEKPCDVWSQNQVLTLSEYLPFHAGANSGTFTANAIRSSVSAGFSCMFDVYDSAFDFEKASMFTEEIARIMQYWDGDFYPLTVPTLEEDCFVAYQLVKESVGYAAVFRRQCCQENNYLLKVQGIDVNATYSLIISDEQGKKTECCILGEELIEGFVVQLPEARSSLLIEYKKNT